MKNGKSRSEQIDIKEEYSENVELLVTAIIAQAASDYQKSKIKLKKLKKRLKKNNIPKSLMEVDDRCEYIHCKAVMGEVRNFLLSEHFYSLTNVDGSAILKRLEEEENGKKNRTVKKRN